jgi:hypothetical protein
VPQCPGYPGLRRRFVRGHRTNDVGTTATCVTATIHEIATALAALTNEPALPDSDQLFMVSPVRLCGVVGGGRHG